MNYNSILLQVNIYEKIMDSYSPSKYVTGDSDDRAPLWKYVTKLKQRSKEVGNRSFRSTIVKVFARDPILE
jgi:hypothetical protein